MDHDNICPMASWLVEPLPQEVHRSVQRIRRAEDVCRVALMPDAHLAETVCVGMVIATRELIYPEAVGRDIGCGMAALAWHSDDSLFDSERFARALLRRIREGIPILKHRRHRELPNEIPAQGLSHQRLRNAANRDGAMQLGTLGRGNHFLEFQTDQQGRLWSLVHSGSRGMGPLITQHHLESCSIRSAGIRGVLAESEEGQAYLQDADWARRYARASRLAMLRVVGEILATGFSIAADWNSLIHSDHNHVQMEEHFAERCWVHRKGAQSAREEESGVIPGSMGTTTYHIRGRGVAPSLMSCSHGAGRRLSRERARKSIRTRDLLQEMRKVHFDPSMADRYREESPGAYKDIRRVMRAQKDLVRIENTLQPRLVFKGGNIRHTRG
ncbi:MAG: RtcB family protein [Planctomycetaceae bacterium]|nr:RtcB family protein [Planctomycetaceae bacterium]